MTTRSQIGIVIVDTTDTCGADEVEDLVRSALYHVPPGRSLVIIWRSENTWTESLPMESIVTDAVLGLSTDRESSDWEFFGNGVTRAYDKTLSSVDFCVNWLLFRRLGDKVYKRRSSVDPSISQQSLLPTLNPVFTRDVANNVWHLSSRTAIKQTMNRLQSLMSWSDEMALVVTNNGSMKRKHCPIELEKDLIGKADKKYYGYFSGEVLFEC